MFAGYGGPSNDLNGWVSGLEGRLSTGYHSLLLVSDSHVGSFVVSHQDMTGVTTMESCFSLANFNGLINDWDVSSVTTLASAFRASTFAGDISGWTTSCK